MSNFDAKTLCILGRQPALGLAELESLYGAEAVSPAEGAALLSIPAGEINFKRLGGTIKVAQILDILNANTWPDIRNHLLKVVPEHLKKRPEGKFTLGLSLYGFDTPVNDINKTALAIKKAGGRPLRVVPNKTPALSSAQVLHNQLTRRGAWELNLFKNGAQTILAQTFFVQDINAYAARDQARPARDARVGMLPPKLAQILINLAVGQIDDRRSTLNDRDDSDPTSNVNRRTSILDPFCGTGVLLQEALLMGYSALGTDIEPRMIEFSQRNLDWLNEQFPGLPKKAVLEVGDATSHQWSGEIGAVASETYLGRPLGSVPTPAKLEEIVQDVNTILRKFLKSLSGQIKPGTPICLAVPAWRTGKTTFKHLPVIDRLTDMGYNVTKFEHVSNKDLIYYRENQIVARQLIVIEARR